MDGHAPGNQTSFSKEKSMPIPGRPVEEAVVFNLKLTRKERDDFKKKTHRRGLTMQSALYAFAVSYNKNPDRFRLVMEMKEG